MNLFPYSLKKGEIRGFNTKIVINKDLNAPIKKGDRLVPSN